MAQEIQALEKEFETLRADGFIIRDEGTALVQKLEAALPATADTANARQVVEAVDRALTFFKQNQNFVIIPPVLEGIDVTLRRHQVRSVALLELMPVSQKQAAVVSLLQYKATDADGLTSGEFKELYNVRTSADPDLDLGPLNRLPHRLLAGAFNLFLAKATAGHWYIAPPILTKMKTAELTGAGVAIGLITAYEAAGIQPPPPPPPAPPATQVTCPPCDCPPPARARRRDNAEAGSTTIQPGAAPLPPQPPPPDVPNDEGGSDI